MSAKHEHHHDLLLLLLELKLAALEEDLASSASTSENPRTKRMLRLSSSTCDAF